jgi:hypothetical protein
MGHVVLWGVPASCSSPRTIFNKGHQLATSYTKTYTHTPKQSCASSDSPRRSLTISSASFITSESLSAGMYVSLLLPPYMYKMYDRAILRLKK